MTREPTVFVVDDDGQMRRLLRELIASAGLRVEVYATARDFLDAFEAGTPGCVVLDMRMPGLSGLELQKELAQRDIHLPVIFLTGYGDVQVAVHAIKAGAVEFVEKPFDKDVLLEQIQNAVADSVNADSARFRQDEIAGRLRLLTPRERQVLDLVVAGDSNKGVARRLDISGRTVEVHRARVMEKMRAKSVASLVKMVTTLADD